MSLYSDESYHSTLKIVYYYDAPYPGEPVQCEFKPDISCWRESWSLILSHILITRLSADQLKVTVNFRITRLGDHDYMSRNVRESIPEVWQCTSYKLSLHSLLKKEQICLQKLLTVTFKLLTNTNSSEDATVTPRLLIGFSDQKIFQQFYGRYTYTFNNLGWLQFDGGDHLLQEEGETYVVVPRAPHPHRIIRVTVRYSTAPVP